MVTRCCPTSSGTSISTAFPDACCATAPSTMTDMLCTDPHIVPALTWIGEASVCPSPLGAIIMMDCAIWLLMLVSAGKKCADEHAVANTIRQRATPNITAYTRRGSIAFPAAVAGNSSAQEGQE